MMNFFMYIHSELQNIVVCSELYYQQDLTPYRISRGHDIWEMFRRLSTMKLPGGITSGVGYC